jgi:hypothetical protein
MEATMSISQQFSDLNSKFVETVNSHDALRWARYFPKMPFSSRPDKPA